MVFDVFSECDGASVTFSLPAKVLSTYIKNRKNDLEAGLAFRNQYNLFPFYLHKLNLLYFNNNLYLYKYIIF